MIWIIHSFWLLLETNQILLREGYEGRPQSGTDNWEPKVRKNNIDNLENAGNETR